MIKTHNGLLYVVATPIGNLQDITLRALEVLKQVDCVAAEDTRHTSGMLAHYGIQKKLIAVHEHNEQQSADSLIERLRAGEQIALVTDAGTPGISDPGAIVVKKVREQGFSVVPIPGCSAVIAALSASGILHPRFHFFGFLPASGAQRRKQLETLSTVDAVLVFYEAPHRIVECIADMQTVMGERNLTIARELTKTFETFYSGNLSGAASWLASDTNQQRGEFVVLLEPAPPMALEGVSMEAERVLLRLLEELPLKQAVKLASDITGEKKNQLYERALTLKKQDNT